MISNKYRPDGTRMIEVKHSMKPECLRYLGWSIFECLRGGLSSSGFGDKTPNLLGGPALLDRLILKENRQR